MASVFTNFILFQSKILKKIEKKYFKDVSDLRSIYSISRYAPATPWQVVWRMWRVKGGKYEWTSVSSTATLLFYPVSEERCPSTNIAPTQQSRKIFDGRKYFITASVWILMLCIVRHQGANFKEKIEIGPHSTLAFYRSKLKVQKKYF